MDSELKSPKIDKKAKCPFEQLLKVKFDVIFEVTASIDECSISVACARPKPGIFEETEEE